MSEIITAVYEKGILRPTRPLNLRENQTVRLQVYTDEPGREAEEVISLLVTAGLLRKPSAGGLRPPDPVSAQERSELAEILGRAPGKPLSQILIEERGPR